MNNEIQNELNEVAPTLAKLPRANAFSVPALYFSTLPQKVIDTALAEELNLVEPQLSPLLGGLKKSKALQVPENYFAQTTSSVLKKIRTVEVAEELVALSPSLSGLEKRNPFAVPVSYYANLPQTVLKNAKATESVATPSAGWVDGINNVLDKLLAPLFTPKLSFAFAAIFVGVMVFWFGMQQTTIEVDAQDRLATQLEKITTEEIRSYIAMNIDEFDEVALSKSISDKKTLLIIDDALLNDTFFEQELLKELDEDFLYNNLEPV
jgi:hypothetical protein